MSRTRRWSLVAVAMAAFGLAACGGSSSSTTTTSRPAATTSTSTTAASASTTTPTTAGSTTTTTGSTSGIATIPTADRSPAGTWGTKPTIVVPSSGPPTQLESADLIVGTGATAKAGDNVTVQYVLATYSSHKEIQSSWGSTPFSFVLGEGNVIKGWDQGVIGMKVGGRRELIIPPSLGYGDQSPGSGIAANDTLVFIVDLQKVG